MQQNTRLSTVRWEGNGISKESENATDSNANQDDLKSNTAKMLSYMTTQLQHCDLLRSCLVSVLHGATKVYNIDDGNEYVFNKGSLFIISPNTRFASKHFANTKRYY